jgi:hypothetical protein
MKVIRMTATAGADRTLRLAVPVETAGGEYEVEVMLTAKTGVNGVAADTPEARGWPKGYFESTYGSIVDETFVRHPQPIPEPIESIR